MHTRKLDKTVKLRHLSALKVLLCVTCGYCVLWKALDRHLKDIHSLPYLERLRYTRVTEQLRLADWDKIIYPEPGAKRIKGLPLLHGYACEADGCKHLCVTLKRMEAHWRREHVTLGSPSNEAVSCRQVLLQTLFRGNLLRYFEVSNSSGQDTSQNSEDLLVYEPVLPSLPKSGGPETTVEWRLIQHFMTDGHLGMLPTKGSQKSWRTQMLQLSAGTEYLRFAILSVLASGIAYAFPDTRHYYGPVADQFRCVAIKALPNMSTVNLEKTFFPLFNFSRLMTMCCIARVQSRWISQTPSSGEMACDEPLLPEWVHVQRQGRALTWHYRGHGRIASAVHGPADRLLPLYPVVDIIFFRNPYDYKLAELADRLRTQSRHLVAPACLEALELLRHVWSVPYRDDACGFRDMALMWTARVTQEYLDLLQNHDAMAVVVFAYYCVLWSFAEGQYWYMQGHAGRMLLKAHQCLAWDWQDWIEWPITMLLGNQPVQQ